MADIDNMQEEHILLLVKIGRDTVTEKHISVEKQVQCPDLHHLLDGLREIMTSPAVDELVEKCFKTAPGCDAVAVATIREILNSWDRVAHK